MNGEGEVLGQLSDLMIERAALELCRIRHIVGRTGFAFHASTVMLRERDRLLIELAIGAVGRGRAGGLLIPLVVVQSTGLKDDNLRVVRAKLRQQAVECFVPLDIRHLPVNEHEVMVGGYPLLTGQEHMPNSHFQSFVTLVECLIHLVNAEGPFLGRHEGNGTQRLAVRPAAVLRTATVIHHTGVHAKYNGAFGTFSQFLNHLLCVHLLFHTLGSGCFVFSRVLNVHLNVGVAGDLVPLGVRVLREG